MMKSQHTYDPESIKRSLEEIVAVRALAPPSLGLDAYINRELVSLADELMADAEPWATDEPLPDLSHLWDTSAAMRPRDWVPSPWQYDKRRKSPWLRDLRVPDEARQQTYPNGEEPALPGRARIIPDNDRKGLADRPLPVGHNQRRVSMRADTPQDQPDQPTPLNERIAEGMKFVRNAHGYTDTETGEFHLLAFIEKLLAYVAENTQAGSLKERALVVKTRTVLMAEMYPEYPTYAECESDDTDPDLAIGIYKSLDREMWTLLRATPTGEIQTRLNGEHGLILCRTKATPTKEWGVYVTRDWKCIDADYLPPLKKGVAEAEGRLTASVKMAIDRIPEHTKLLRGQMLGALRDSLNRGKEEIDLYIEAGQVEDEQDDNSDDKKGEK